MQTMEFLHKTALHPFAIYNYQSISTTIVTTQRSICIIESDIETRQTKIESKNYLHKHQLYFNIYKLN